MEFAGEPEWVIDLEFYFNRPTLDNDPRGLGAVITAGIEISKLEVRIKE